MLLEKDEKLFNKIIKQINLNTKKSRQKKNSQSFNDTNKITKKTKF